MNIYIFSALGAFALLFVLLYIFSSSRLTVTHTEIKLPYLTKGVRLVLLSDMHRKYWGKDNERLCKIIKEQNPDAIVCAGDMTDTLDTGKSPFAAMLRRLDKSFPVYYAPGNHEARKRAKDEKAYYDFIDKIKELGAVYLENNSSCFGGISIYGIDCSSNGKCSLEIIGNRFGKPQWPCILLAHNPLEADKYADAGFELIFCGHMHGGAIKLPLIGGILSPSRRLFPKYRSGLYRVKSSAMYVTRGVGYVFPDRVFAYPEVSVIELMPE